MTTAGRVVTFGEIMMRLSPPGLERLLQTSTLSATFGGGEANVAVSLAHFGLDSVYVTALPAHAIGEAAVRALRAEGVRTDRIVRSGDRVGIYFAETGASQRASTVIYDRAHSSIAALAAEAIHWPDIMAGAAWFHVSGITPALGNQAAESTRQAIEAARTAGARVSFDLNFRRKLWSEAEAQRVVGPLLRQVDVLIANEEDLQSVLGIHVGARVALDRMQFLGVRRPAEIEPELVVEADRVDDERVAFPMANRVSIPRRIEISGMLASVHEDLTVAVDVALEQQERVRGRLQDSPRIRVAPRYAGRETVGLGIVLRVPAVHDLLVLGADGQRLTLGEAVGDVADRAAALPHA